MFHTLSREEIKHKNFQTWQNHSSFTMKYIHPDMMYVPTIFIYQKKCTKTLSNMIDVPSIGPRVTVSPMPSNRFSGFLEIPKKNVQPKDSNKLILSESYGKRNEKHNKNGALKKNVFLGRLVSYLHFRAEFPRENIIIMRKNGLKNRPFHQQKLTHPVNRRDTVPCPRSKKQPGRRPTRPGKESQHLWDGKTGGKNSQSTNKNFTKLLIWM